MYKSLGFWHKIRRTWWTAESCLVHRIAFLSLCLRTLYDSDLQPFLPAVLLCCCMYFQPYSPAFEDEWTEGWKQKVWYVLCPAAWWLSASVILRFDEVWGLPCQGMLDIDYWLRAVCQVSRGSFNGRYTFLLFLVSLNILLAIIVESFLRVKQERASNQRCGGMWWYSHYILR